MIATVDTVGPTNNLWGERWSKLCVNGMRNGISAATGLGGVARDRDDRLRWLSIKLGGEAVRVGQALGYALEPIGNLDPERLALAAEGDRAARDEMEALISGGSNIRGRSEQQRPSMAQDMAKGRRTEIDFINGVIVERGHDTGRPGADPCAADRGREAGRARRASGTSGEPDRRCRPSDRGSVARDGLRPG